MSAYAISGPLNRRIDEARERRINSRASQAAVAFSRMFQLEPPLDAEQMRYRSEDHDATYFETWAAAYVDRRGNSRPFFVGATDDGCRVWMGAPGRDELLITSMADIPMVAARLREERVITVAVVGLVFGLPALGIILHSIGLIS